MPEPEIKDITTPISLVTTKEINGLWSAVAEITKNDYITANCYVEFDKELYISKKIRKIKTKGKITFEVKLHHVMVELNNKTIAPLEYTDETPTEMMTTILSGTKWSVGTVDSVSTGKIKSEKRITALAALNMVAKQFGSELYFNCIKGTNGVWTRTVDLRATIGDQTSKLMVRYDKNSDSMERVEDVEKLCTRLFIYGKDDLTISSVNGGVEYLDSAHIGDYTEPIEVTVYTKIDDPARLLTYGQIYLSLYEHPLYSYILDVFDKSIFPTWDMETFNLGDNIRVQDKDLDTNSDHRIQRIKKDLTKGTMTIELENLEDKITDLLALLDWYKDNPHDGYDTNPFTPGELPPYYPPEIEPVPIPMSGMYLVKADTLADGASLKHIARKKIAVDSYGQLWVVYNRSDGSHTQIYCSRSENGQIWTESCLTDSGGDDADFGEPSIAIDSNNVVYIVFDCVNLTPGGDGNSIQFIKYDGGWSSPAIIDFTQYFGQNYVGQPSIAVDSNDVVHVLGIWIPLGGRVYHKSSDDGGDSWSDDVLVWDSGGGLDAINSDNAVAFEIDQNDVLHVGICWIDYPATDIISYLNSSNGGATWSIPVTLNHTVGGGQCDTISLAADSQNNIHAIWVEDTSTTKIYYSKRSGGAWSHPIVISNPAVNSLGGTIGVDEKDNLYVVWSGYKGSYRQIKMKSFSGLSWSTELTQTTNLTHKRYPTVVQATFPIVNGIRYNISNGGFMVLFVDDNDIWIWFNCNWHI